MEEFHTKAHIDEYVLGRDKLGTFSASDGRLTYARPEDESATSIPLTEVTTIRFERNTTLHHMNFLGICAVALAFVLTSIPTARIYLNGVPETQAEALIVGLVSLLAIGAWFTAHDYLSVGNHDIIDLYIRTAEESHVVCGSVDDTEFVDACERLINSNVSTTNQNSKLASEIS